jgi:phosphodiesterase/alkaline phosphatase D-like protein
MAVQDSNDKIAQLLKQACPPAAASPEFKAKLQQHLNDQAGALGTESPKPLWQQPFLWIPAAAASAVALVLVIYFVVFHSVPLTVTTSDATGIWTTAATLNGNLDSLGTADSVDVSFEWGVSTDYGNETTPELRTAAGSVQADLSGLAPNTTYHFRIKAAGRDGTVYGPDMQFTTGPAPPVATTSDVAKIKTTSATLRGSLDSLGTATTVTVSFEYGTATGSYTHTTADQARTSTGAFSADLTGLTPGTTYYYRAKADGDGDPIYGAEKTFTTSTTAPSVTTNDATNFAMTSATLNGELASLGTAGSATVSFVWGTAAGAYTQTTANQSRTITGAFSADLAAGSLTPGTTYYYRAVADGDGPPVYGVEKTFTTLTTAPTVTTNDASNPATTSATLNGNLTTLGTAATVNVSFEWGTATGAYTQTTANQSRTITGAFSADLAAGSLTPGTTYYYRAKADGDGAPVYGVEKSFTTLAAPPLATTNSATQVRCSSATLNGVLDSLGTAVTVDVSFEWGLTTAYGSETTPGSKTTTGDFNATLTDLIPNTAYHFRAKTVGDGIAYGADMVFTTGNAPPPQRTWYLGGDSSGTPNVMYDGDTSKQTGTVALGYSAASYTQIWIADEPNLVDTQYAPGNWTVQLTLSHIKASHIVNVEIGTWMANAFTSYGTYTLLGQGKDNTYAYTYEADFTVSSFTVPSGGYVATRVKISNNHLMYVHVGGSQSYVISPAYPEPTAPTVATSAATSVEPTTATLNGSLDSLGTAGSVTPYFEWGTTTDYGGNEIEVGPQASGGSFSMVLANLIPNTSYHFRAKAVGDGTNYGVDMIFTTPP